jgi:DNA-binding transcriptional regulator YbjK
MWKVRHCLDPRFERTTERVTEAVLALLEEAGPEAVIHQRVAESAGGRG